MALREQALAEVAADESGAAGDENSFHCVSSGVRRWRRDLESLGRVALATLDVPSFELRPGFVNLLERTCAPWNTQCLPDLPDRAPRMHA